jgi:hypothetical protein
MLVWSRLFSVHIDNHASSDPSSSRSSSRSGERAVAVRDPAAAAGISRAAPGQPTRDGCGGDQGGGRRLGVNPRASGDQEKGERRKREGPAGSGLWVRTFERKRCGFFLFAPRRFTHRCESWLSSKWDQMLAGEE